MPTYPFARERYWVGEVAAAAEPIEVSAVDDASERVWVFSKDADGNGLAVAMAPAEKIALFLRQETALQLQKPIDEIPPDQSYFDLGLTSLGMAHIVQNTCTLLEESLLPSVLFEHRDIQSLSAYLAAQYPARLEVITAVRQGNGDATPPRKPRASETAAPTIRTTVTAVETHKSVDDLLEQLSWQEESLDGYEKVTF